MCHNSHDMIKQTLSVSKVAIVSVNDIVYETHDIRKDQV